MTVLTERQYEIAARLAEEEREAALARLREQMNEGQASPDGCCLDCGELIPAARLAALPNAGRCVECQGKREYQQKTTGF